MNPKLAIPGTRVFVPISFYALTLAFMLAPRLRADVLDASLKVRFNFDAEPAGDVIVDSSPAGGHSGTNNLAVWSASESGRNGVMNFDGTAPSQITLSAAPDLNSSVGAITFWMKSDLVTPTPNPYAIIFDRRETPGSGGDVLYQDPDGHVTDQAEAADRAGANALSTTLSLTDGNWHHIAYVYDQSATGSVSIYVDGILDKTGTNSVAWAWKPDLQISIGKATTDTFWSGYTGFLDDFRIYDRLLTPSEIADIAGLGTAPLIVIKPAGQPEDRSIAENDTASFTVNAVLVNGDPAQLHYQWQKEGVDIPGATNATYSFPVTVADNGKKFRSQLTAPGAPNVTSAEATLTVIPDVTLIFSFDAAPVADVIVDSTPGTVKHAGQNAGAMWVSSEDGRNGVMQFDGTLPSQITIAPAPELTSARGTIAFWMKSTNVTAAPNQYAALFDRRDSTVGGDIIYQSPDGHVNNQASGGANDQATTGNLTDGKWHHVVCLYDQTANGSVSLYVDGVLDTTRANNSAWAWNPDLDFNIGFSTHDSFWSGFTGFLDEFRFYNRVLSATEIATLAGLGPQPKIVVTRQPTNLTGALNDRATFSVGASVANGNPATLQYQWQKNGTDILGATSSNYTFVATAADNGKKFRVRLSAFGATNVISDEVTLNVVELALVYNFDADPVNDVIVDNTALPTKHDGVNVGATWVASEDGHNGVMNFDGTIPSQITIPPAPEFNWIRGTIAFWMKSDVVTPTQDQYAIIFDHRETPGSGGDVIYQDPTGHLNNQAEAAGRARANVQITTKDLTDGQWHHIAYVYDQTAGASVSIYVDGLLDTTKANSRDWAWNPNLQIEIGKSHDPFWSGYTGFLDEFRIYNRMLSPNEVAQLAGVSPVQPTLSISINGTSGSITWSGTGFSLQESSNLANPNGWTDVPNGGVSPVPITVASTGAKFYRLIKP